MVEGKRALSSSPVEVVLIDRSIEDLQLRLVPLSNVSGQLEYEDEHAKPTSSSAADEVTLQSLTLDSVTRPTKIAEDGSFLLELVPPDTYRINISRAGVYVKSNLLGNALKDGSMLDLRNGAGGQTLSVRLSSAVAELSGTVSRGNDAAAGARVVLTMDDAEAYGFYRIANADAAGAFAIRGIPPGKYKVLALESGSESPVVRGRFTEQYDAAAESLELAPADKVTRALKLR